MTIQTSEHIVRQLLEAFADFNTSEEQLKSFVTPDFEQKVDGRTLTLDDFLAHTHALRSTLRSFTITIEHSVCQGDSVATVHVVNAIHTSGRISTVKVIAFFKIREGRIALVDELTHVQEGNTEDKSLGSLR